MDATDWTLAQLLQVSDDFTSTVAIKRTSTPANTGSWSDVSSAEWEQLLVAIDNASENDDTDATSVPTDDDTNMNRRSCQSQRYRERKRVELAMLRSEVTKLQETLYHLQATQQNESKAIQSDPTQNAVVMAWKRMAAHQKAARRNVEEENVRLRTAIVRERQVAYKLERLVQKRSTQSDDSMHRTAKRLRQEKPFKTHLFEQLRRQIETRVVEVDALLDQVGFAKHQVDLDHTRVCCVRDASVVWEVLFAKVFPFRHDKTAEVVWQFCRSTPPPAGRQAVVESHSEMLFELPMRVRHCEALFEAHVVMRRSTEKSRIIQWYEGTWVLRSPHKAYDGIVLHDRGWHVIQDLADTAMDAEPSAIVQCCSQLQLDTAQVSQPDEVQLLREVVMEVYHQQLQNSFKQFETELIEHLLSGKCVQYK